MARHDDPLNTLRILDLSRILAGPTCTQLLADLAADVMTVENPLVAGDDTRSWGQLMSPTRQQSGGSKRLFHLRKPQKAFDCARLFHAGGQETLRKLAIKADVLVENFKPGALTKFGLDYTRLQKQTPRLVYCSISGFGQGGPNAKNPTTIWRHRPTAGSCR